MAIKPIKIVTGIAGWDTKLYINGEDVTEKIGGIFGIDIEIRVDGLPRVTINRFASNIEFESKNCETKIVNHKPKKVKKTDAILENTNFSNAKKGRHYIKKEV